MMVKVESTITAGAARIVEARDCAPAVARHPLAPDNTCGDIACTTCSVKIRKSILGKLARRYPTEWALVGGLSAPSKMPTLGYSIPARYCATGSILRRNERSTCRRCYALKGRYIFKNVQRALERRYQSITHPKWVDAMVTLIKAAGLRHFRWHDSGDIQGDWHLANIAAVARRTPSTKHWIPTREYLLLANYQGSIPSNLTIRVSMPLIDSFKLTERLSAYPVSGVHTDKRFVPSGALICGAPARDGHCGPCRACWNTRVKVVSYHVH